MALSAGLFDEAHRHFIASTKLDPHNSVVSTLPALLDYPPSRIGLKKNCLNFVCLRLCFCTQAVNNVAVCLLFLGKLKEVSR